MKHFANQTEKDAFADLKSKKSSDLLKHILSPIELTAIRKNYRPFKYRLDGYSIYVTDIACKQLLSITRHKVGFFTGVIHHENLTHNNSFQVKRLLDSPQPILDLPTFLRNRLLGLECYNMFDVIQLGRKKLSHSRGFGKVAMKELDALFSKHGCSHLFQ